MQANDMYIALLIKNEAAVISAPPISGIVAFCFQP